MSTMLNDPREMCSPTGIPRPFPSEHPRPLQYEIRTVVAPRSNVVNLRSRNVVLYRPGMPIHDWRTEPDVADPPG